MVWFYILIFLISCAFLYFAGQMVIECLAKIARFLGWKEFVVAFFLMAFSCSIPNFFVGIISALNKVPELSFADIIGGNVVELALLGGLAALISRMGLSTQSRTVQGSTIFGIGTALLPLILISDGNLSRVDGILLILTFIFYIFWLFNKKERFEKIYDGIKEPVRLKFFLKNLAIFIVSFFLLILAAKGVVKSSLFFANYLKVSLSLIGILIVSLGNSLPDLSFILRAAKKSQDWLILGDIMGGTVITATLVLGIVALIHPIKILDFSPFLIGFFFLIISALFFLFFVRTDRKVTKKEGIFLLSLYVIFFIVEILIK